MERLWAPWRMTYIKKHSDQAPCFLCAAVKGKRDRSTFVVARGRHCFAILNRYPYASGHLMVTPNAHRGSLAEMTPEEKLELMDLSQRVQGALGKAYRPDGYNMGINLGRVAGAGLLGHLHLHVVPRWNGDTNFMPVMSGVKVMPLTLKDVHAAVTKALRSTT